MHLDWTAIEYIALGLFCALLIAALLWAKN
jgi:hypothetical protein